MIMTSKDLTKDKSFELAESTRDTAKHEGFLAGLFEGKANFGSLFPYSPAPQGSPDEAIFLMGLKKFLFEKVDPVAIDRTGEIPDAVIQELKDVGTFGIKIPKKYGGLGFSQSVYKQAAFLLGSWDANVTALVSAACSIGVGQPLMYFGTEEQRQLFAPRIAKGAISGFGLTEPNAGSDLTRIRTYAQRMYHSIDRLIGYSLNGEKLYTTNATKSSPGVEWGQGDVMMPYTGEFLAELLVIIARIVDDPTELDNPAEKPVYGAFIVETNSPGMSVLQRCHFMGLKALYSGGVGMQGVFVPEKNMLGREGDGIKIALSTLAIGRLTLPAACVGGLKQHLAIQRWWGSTRVQWFNTEIGYHEQNSKKLADIAANTFALEAIVNILCRKVDEHEDVRLESAAVKVLGSEWLSKAVDDTLQLRSGRGYETAESLIERDEIPVVVERAYRDVRINRIFEGTSEVMRLWQAREEMDGLMKIGIPFIKRSSMADKAAATVRIATLFMNPTSSALPRRVPDVLKKHLVFVRKTAKKLLRNAIIASGINGNKMARKQLITTRLADIAMELFAISCTVSYAQHLTQSSAEEKAKYALHLADYFCWTARNRINPPSKMFDQLFCDSANNLAFGIARDVLKGNYLWLEEGIVPVLDKHGLNAVSPK